MGYANMAANGRCATATLARRPGPAMSGADGNRIAIPLRLAVTALVAPYVPGYTRPCSLQRRAIVSGWKSMA